MTEAKGQRGKLAEKAVEAVFRELNKSVGFAFHRLADARSARNFMAANPADFIYSCNGQTGFVEVKSMAHPFRLPAKNVTQLPTLVKFELAGARSVILVNHTLTGKWRALAPNDLPMGVPSWDLRSHPEFSSPAEALVSLWMF